MIVYSENGRNLKQYLYDYYLKDPKFKNTYEPIKIAIAELTYKEMLNNCK